MILANSVVPSLSLVKEEQQIKCAHFTEKLMLHAQTEEEVLDPAAILIGEYLNLKLTP